MPKYHITPSQQIKECNAKSPEACPFSSESPHFNSIKEAEEYRDKMAKKQNGTLPMFIFKDAKQREARAKALEKIEAIRQETEEQIEALKKEEKKRIEAIACKFGRWHITPSQQVKPCLFETGKCPFQNESPHFDSKQEAEEYRDKNKKD